VIVNHDRRTSTTPWEANPEAKIPRRAGRSLRVV
jgi:hypothetical protein